MTGTTLSHYRIEDELGRGGMGIVYRALDTKLNRDVALKILPAAALASEDDRARFFREAQAAAQLHHPNICTVFEIDEAVPSDAPHGTQPSPFIVMEYIEGETLDARIKNGPLKISEAIRLAGEVAEALKMAHSKDIVHRDIKSANIMLDAEGRAKVLDFGLAKTAQSTQLTRLGSTLGTISYMSPEQARAEEVDHRTDIWALGVVLYEMVSGQHPFAGDYEQAVIYSILNEDPEPLTALRTGVPLSVEGIVEKCLRKEAKHRYQSAAGVIADLEAVKSGSGSASRTGVRGSIAASTPAVASAQKSNRTLITWIVALILTAFVAAILGRMTSPEIKAPLATFVLSEGPRNVDDMSRSVIAPDGQNVAIKVSDQIYLRAMSSAELRPLPGTENGGGFFWSPDSRYLAFFRGGSVWKVDILGGAPIQLSPLPPGYPFGGAWSTDGDLYLSIASGPGIGDFYTVNERGGTAEKVVVSDTTMQTGAFFGPTPLPGYDGILFSWFRQDNEGNQLTSIYRLSGQEAVPVADDVFAFFMAYHPDGYLLIEDDANNLWSIPYQPGSEPITGERVLLARNVWGASTSNNESLLYMRTNPGNAQFGWVDIQGRELGRSGSTRENQRGARISPDGSVYVFTAEPNVNDVSSAQNPFDQIFIHHTSEDTEQVLLESTGVLWGLSFAPDGHRIAVGYDWDIWLTDADGIGWEPLVTSGAAVGAPTWTPDGKVIYENHGRGQSDLWIRDPHPDSTARPLLESPIATFTPQVSADGRFLVYTVSSDNSGNLGSNEVFIRNFRKLSDPARRLGPGYVARWSSDGQTLYTASTDTMYRWNAPVDLSGSVEPPVALFGLEHLGLVRNSGFSVGPAEDRFLMNFQTTEATESTVLVQNWKRLIDE